MKRLLIIAGALLLLALPVSAQTISSTANSVYRDFYVDGNAASGAYNPPKADIRALWGTVDTRFTATDTSIAAKVSKAGDTMTGQLIAPSIRLSSGGGLAGNVLNSTYTSTSATTPSWGFLEGNAVTPSGANFHEPFVVQENTSGAGNHGTFTSILNSSAASVGNQLVGFQGLTTLTAGSGSAFGGNFVAIANSGVATTAEVVGGEINTSVLNASVIRKVGLQIIDTAGSGGGTTLDAGLVIGRGSGSTGYNSGIMFDAGGGSGVKTGGNLIVAPTATVNVGLEWSTTTFTSFAIRVPGLTVGATSSPTVNMSTLAGTGNRGVCVDASGNLYAHAAGSC